VASVFRIADLAFEPRKSPVDAFQWLTSPRLHQLVGARMITKFDVRSLDPGKFSFPYHFHRAAEEIFVILNGEATLRTPKGFVPVQAGEILFFEAGADGAHQLFNHGNQPCVYVDVSVSHGPDVVEYPDSDKIGVDGVFFRRESQIDYYDGEEDPAAAWPQRARPPAGPR
jgi:uncharacterized cupin superfamily protein